jgi:hypothetical protein
MRLLNIIPIVNALITRGNWKLIRHSYKQLLSFISCRSGLNKMSPFSAIFYWYDLLKGPDMLLWRLETFGFIFQRNTSIERKNDLNSYI